MADSAAPKSVGPAEPEPESEDLHTCAICLADMTTAAEVARPTVCQHLFCRTCLESLCRSGSRRCPLDRKKFDEICIRRRSDSNEIVFNANSMRPMFFTSPAVALGSAGFLIAALWASPTWLMFMHVLSIIIIYHLTTGQVDERYYLPYSIIFYFVLLPVNLIGFAVTLYAVGIIALLAYWHNQISEMTRNNGDATAEKSLLTLTGVLLTLVFPAVTFSWYSILQIFLYAWCVISYCGLQIKLSNALGQEYTRYSLIFSCLVMAPYLCQLSDVTLPYLIYNGIIMPLWLYYVHESGAGNGVQWFRKLSRLIYQLSPVLLLGYPPWGALYIFLVLNLLQQSKLSGHLARVGATMPLLLIVSLAMLLVVLPCQVLGLKSHIMSTVLFCSGFGLIKLIDSVMCEGYRLAAMPIIDLFTFNILIPALIFPYL